MHHWVNDLCALAAGDWLFLFNDDARMRTNDWDQWLLNAELKHSVPGLEDICLLVAETINRPTATEFMFLNVKYTKC